MEQVTPFVAAKGTNGVSVFGLFLIPGSIATDKRHSSSVGWKHYLAGLCGFVLGFWLCMPRNVVLMPRYEVLVENASGKGLASVQVEQLRQDYVISNTTSFSFSTDDSYGRVAFPAVSGRASPLLRILH